MLIYSSLYGLKPNIAGFEWFYRNIDFVAEKNKAYDINTSFSDVLMTLPQNPAPGDEVAFLVSGNNKLNISFSCLLPRTYFKFIHRRRSICYSNNARL